MLGAIIRKIETIFGIYISNLLESSRFAKDNTTINKVQAGYIAPSRLKIKCKDLDGNGELETIIKADDKKHLLRKDKGQLEISPYKIVVVDEVAK